MKKILLICNHTCIEIKEYENGLTFVLTFVGIPIIYYGTEQEFDGCSDPDNREVLFPLSKNVNSTLYQFIGQVISIRKKYEVWKYKLDVVASQDNFYAYTRGNNVLVCLTNVGDNAGTMEYQIDASNANLTVNTTYCNLLIPQLTDCFVYQTNQSLLTIYLSNGEPKIYVNYN